MERNSTMLNLSYVITASIKFQNTLQNIIKGLQQSGFGEKDYREKDIMPEFVKEEAKQESLDNFFFPEQIEVGEEDVIDVRKINFNPNQINQNINTTVFEIEGTSHCAKRSISKNNCQSRKFKHHSTNLFRSWYESETI